jgi:hypothetical protein
MFLIDLKLLSIKNDLNLKIVKNIQPTRLKSLMFSNMTLEFSKNVLLDLNTDDLL